MIDWRIRDAEDYTIPRAIQGMVVRMVNHTIPTVTRTSSMPTATMMVSGSIRIGTTLTTSGMTTARLLSSSQPVSSFSPPTGEFSFAVVLANHRAFSLFHLNFLKEQDIFCSRGIGFPRG